MKREVMIIEEKSNGIEMGAAGSRGQGVSRQFGTTAAAHGNRAGMSRSPNARNTGAFMPIVASNEK